MCLIERPIEKITLITRKTFIFFIEKKNVFFKVPSSYTKKFLNL